MRHVLVPVEKIVLLNFLTEQQFQISIRSDMTSYPFSTNLLVAKVPIELCSFSTTKQMKCSYVRFRGQQRRFFSQLTAVAVSQKSLVHSHFREVFSPGT